MNHLARMTLKNEIRPGVYRAFNRSTSSATTNQPSDPARQNQQRGKKADDDSAINVNPDAHEKAFNTSPELKDFKENEEYLKQFAKDKDPHHSKEFVERNFKGYGGLKEKGEKIAQEQDRPEDYM